MMLLSFGACKTESANASKKMVEEIKTDGQMRNSDIIRNPISADSPLDTTNLAKITFKETSFDFGTVDEGEEVNHTFEFTNTGKAPLLISDARSSCGCTVPEWPKHPIPPGESGKIDVLFRTKGKQNKQEKPVTLSTNAYPPQAVVYMRGFVTPKPENKK